MTAGRPKLTPDRVGPKSMTTDPPGRPNGPGEPSPGLRPQADALGPHQAPQPAA